MVQEFFKLFLFKSNLILRGKYIIFLFENKQKLDKLKEKIKSSDRIFLFLDYDGTLTRLRKNPLDAVLSKGKIKVLKRLSLNKNIILTVVSGRTLSNLLKVSGIDFPAKINIAGTHGAELLIKNKPHCFLKKTHLKIIKIIKKDIENLLQDYPCFQIEDKNISFAVHYRNCSKSELKIIPKIRKLIEHCTGKKAIKILVMKKVFEVMPLSIDKGKIIEIIKKESDTQDKSLTICIGDDKTDEFLFKNNAGGINIKVAKTFDADSLASFYLKNTIEVFNFLKILLGKLIYFQ